jgi:hypothetical protein
VERGSPVGIAPARVGAGAQEREQGGGAGVDRHRAVEGAPTAPIAGVGVGAPGEQADDRVGRVVLDGEVEGRVPLQIAEVGVGAGREQGVDGAAFGMPAGGEVEGRGPLAVAGVGIVDACEEGRNQVEVGPVLAGDHQRGGAIEVGDLRCSALQIAGDGGEGAGEEQVDEVVHHGAFLSGELPIVSAARPSRYDGETTSTVAAQRWPGADGTGHGSDGRARLIITWPQSMPVAS